MRYDGMMAASPTPPPLLGEHEDGLDSPWEADADEPDATPWSAAASSAWPWPPGCRRSSPDAVVTVLEKEDALAPHQTGRNSGVVHAGLYYTPGSLKARLCRRGRRDAAGVLRGARRRLRRDRQGARRARRRRSEGRLAAIEERARANGVPGVRRLGAGELREIEPHVPGVAGLHSPTTAIADFPGVTRALARLVEAPRRQRPLRHRGDRASARTAGGVRAARATRDGTSGRRALRPGRALRRAARDRLAGWPATSPDPRIVPFRGEYYLLRPERRVARPRAGLPGARPALPVPRRAPDAAGRRRGAGRARTPCSRWPARATAGARSRVRDLREAAPTPASASFARQHWRTGVAEMAGSLSKRRFVAAARRYVPELRRRRRRPRTGRHPRPGPRPRRQPGRRLPDQLPRAGRRPAQRAVAGGDLEPGHRRAPRRRRLGRTGERSHADEHAARPRALGGARDALRRRRRRRPRVAATTGRARRAGRGPTASSPSASSARPRPCPSVEQRAVRRPRWPAPRAARGGSASPAGRTAVAVEQARACVDAAARAAARALMVQVTRRRPDVLDRPPARGPRRHRRAGSCCRTTPWSRGSR